MKDNFRGSVGTLVVLIDGLMLATIIIGLFWYAGRNTIEVSAPQHAFRSTTVDSRR
ncbi:MAG TPA: hypothetical protein VL460_09195 [Caulobacteraceae bacterium]|jgi:hypothetical protein|nr:hypothetical protein [Caulobacteraceae bacterium]